ncbi:MAG TPA: BTAD domain-containing putative transcriptional regulator [Ktedonobacteraceae bacterium]|nr:BTAD domain-containing putative transcriptional regulator [Ktedonobacteraceae bacterium]
MNSSSSPEQDARKNTPEASSTLALLQSGLSCTQEGRYSEGIAFFALAREKLLPDMAQLAFKIDMFIKDYVEYCQSQQALQHASARFIKAHTQQQMHTTSLANLLSALQEKTENNAETTTANIQFYSKPTDPPSGSISAPAISGKIEAGKIVPHKPEEQSEGTLAPLHFTCFGRFEVKQADKTLELCSNRNGQGILRYLVAQPNHRASMDTLMSIFWPDNDPDMAHHKLQVAISALRRSLNCDYVTNGGGYLLCKNGVYQISPNVSIQTDVAEFLALYHTGKQQQSRNASVPYYEAACQLYKGPFLAEDLYVDWPMIQREQLNQTYLAMCGTLSEYYLENACYEDAAKWASAVLNENHCDEVAYRLLMRINLAAGRRSEALRQYQRCERALAEELNVAPMPETLNLFHSILKIPSSSIEQK